MAAQGVTYAAESAMAEGGFANSEAIKIPFPPECAEVVISPVRTCGRLFGCDHGVAGGGEAP